MDKIRVRFAPSPTGYLHIGNARTALFNWLLARGHNGFFILRIEDTDLDRSEQIYMDHIMDDLRWLGLDWDEGPDVGGPYGPYRQTDRLTVYSEFAEKLIKEGKAYYCYCTNEELETRRKDALAKGRTIKYDNRCRDLTREQIAEYESRGVKPALRFKVEPRTIEIDDIVRGRVSFDTNQMGDFVIMKGVGVPAFNFAVTVDDCLMEITHVIRGEDHLSNTPRHIMLFEALGYKLPQFAHMSMTLGPNGGRLSKRSGATSIADYRKRGYLPQGLVNYLALLGWSPKDDREMLSTEELKSSFDLSGLNKSSAIFDRDKLNWLSGQYIRVSPVEKITDLAISYLQEDGYLHSQVNEQQYNWLLKMIESIQDHLHCVSEVCGFADIFFNKKAMTLTAEEEVVLKTPESKQVLEALAKNLGDASKINPDKVNEIFKQVQTETGQKGKKFFMPVRLALTGRAHGPELTKIIPVLNHDLIFNRLKKWI